MIWFEIWSHSLYGFFFKPCSNQQSEVNFQIFVDDLGISLLLISNLKLLFEHIFCIILFVFNSFVYVNTHFYSPDRVYIEEHFLSVCKEHTPCRGWLQCSINVKWYTLIDNYFHILQIFSLVYQVIERLVIKAAIMVVCLHISVFVSDNLPCVLNLCC